MAINYTNDSKAIEFWEYNMDDVLRIKYRSGRTYDYLDVPSDVVGELVNRPSFGAAVSCFIRGKYEYKEVMA